MLPGFGLGELLELKPQKTTYNLRSMIGVPISTTLGDPLGSNGLSPTSDATAGQFMGFYSAGAVVAPQKDASSKLDGTISLFKNVDNLGLPKSEDGEYTLLSGVSGGAIMSPQASLMFGGIVSVPEKIKVGSEEVAVRNPDAYWAKEPFKAGHQIEKVLNPNVGVAIVHTKTATDYQAGDLVAFSGIAQQEFVGSFVLLAVSANKKELTFKLPLTDSQKNQAGINASLGNVADGGAVTTVALLPSGGLCREEHSSSGYHYSPYAKTVFAIQPGPIKITWKESRGEAEQPTGEENVDWTVSEEKYYKLYTYDYLVSSSSVKKAKKFFWNVADYSGPDLQVPENVKLEIAYNRSFPEHYDGNEYNSKAADMQKNKTLWVQSNANLHLLKAINVAGRVFIELVGKDNNKHLGFEVVDIFKVSEPEHRTIYLGDKLTPYEDSSRDTSYLEIEFVGTSSPMINPFTLDKAFAGSINYYATRETADEYDCVAFWKEKGLEDLVWPVTHVSYELKWPEDLTEYSHYVRPDANESASKVTAIQLPVSNSPLLRYQDLDSNSEARSKITDEGLRFYSWMRGPDDDSGQQGELIYTHRALVSYESTQAGIRFERIFSWLDDNLENNDLNTRQVRNLNIWPKVTIDGNLDLQVLLQQDDGSLTSRKNTLRQTVFSALGGGQGVNAVTQSRSYPNSPESSELITSFESTVTSGTKDDYGVVIEGFFKPLETAEYQFSLNSDDWGELEFSMTNNPKKRNIIATESTRRAHRDYSDNSDDEEVSPFFYLDSNNHYYIKAIMKDGEGADHLSVSYRQSPTETMQSTPVPGNLFKTGLRVLPLEQDMENGDRINFSDTMYFVMNADALRGSTVIQGTLFGIPANGVIDGITGSTFRPDIVSQFNDRVLLDAPRYLTATAYVGERLKVPEGEYTGSDGYWAGYVDVDKYADPNSKLPYHEEAYIDPLQSGFGLANTGSIIPVNALPGNKTIVVNWFRRTIVDSDPTSGFEPVYWPSVIVEYTIDYPQNPREIVMASNDGTGPLSSLEAKGKIYYQNEPSLTGYNPNEEHALMVGGQAYALRDDLNIQVDDSDTPENEFSSEPFVLLEYEDSDGKLSISTFKVLRDKPEEGVVFDYLVEAGSIIQAPMPLPLLKIPADNYGSSFNAEVQQSGTDDPATWDQLKNASYFSQSSTYEEADVVLKDTSLTDYIPSKEDALTDPQKHFEHYNKFTFEDRKQSKWVYRGLHEGPPPLQAGKYLNRDTAGAEIFENTLFVEAEVGQLFELNIHASRMTDELQMSPQGTIGLPLWLSTDGLLISGTPDGEDATTTSAGQIKAEDESDADATLVILDAQNDLFKAGQTVAIPGAGAGGSTHYSVISSSYIDSDDGDKQKLRLADEASTSVVSADIYQVHPIVMSITESRLNQMTQCEVLIRVRQEGGSPSADFEQPQNLLETTYPAGFKTARLIGRPPYLAGAPTGENSFKMKFYYHTQEGFAFPGMRSLEDEVGRIVPYMLSKSHTESALVKSDLSQVSEPLHIVYRPVWPRTTPTLNRGDTLTLPKYGLPAMRGQSSAEVIYQQSLTDSSFITDSNKSSGVKINYSGGYGSNSIKVTNPTGKTYGQGTYAAVHIQAKTDYSPGGDWQPYVEIDRITGDWYNKEWRGRIKVKPLQFIVPADTVLTFSNGSTLTLDQAYPAGAVWINGDIESDKWIAFQARWRAAIPSSEAGLRVEQALGSSISAGSRFSFAGGNSFFIAYTGASASSTILTGALFGADVSDGDKAASVGFSVNAGGYANGGLLIEQRDMASINNGDVFKFHNGATFTVNASAADDHVALSGVLAGGEVDSGAQSYQVVDITVDATQAAYVVGDVIFFENANFVFTSDAAAGLTTLTGILTGSVEDDGVGYNASSLISATESVKLIDPTREKESRVVRNTGEDFAFPPGSIPTSYYQGKIYFPTLDPHLSKRIFFDPNRGTDGALVLLGKFMDELVGEKYLQLNVLSAPDYADLINLCQPGDPSITYWKDVVKNLAADMEHFVEARNADEDIIKGVFEKDPNNSYIRNVSEVAEVYSSNVPVDSYALSAVGPGEGYVSIVVGNGNGKVQPVGEPVTVHIIRIVDQLHPGSIKVVQAENPLDEKVTFYHSPDLAAKVDKYEYEWRKGYPVDGSHPPFDAELDKLDDQWIEQLTGAGEHIFVLGEKPGIDTLMDLYLTMRYKPLGTQDWSVWAKPQLAEGWIKRVLAGINPFNQRVTDMFNNPVNLDYSMLTQAGKRWEGDVALSLESINDFGLIEIYETVLNRGKMLSIDAGINHNGANNALLLAAGYLNDLYMMVGNDAYADAFNPTIGFGTADGEFGDISTALFSFKGQLATLLDEELALLRGRDDFMAPGVEANPVYNRLFWNYTRGINSGEVVYALNYNIKDRGGEDLDGKVDAADATRMYPQGHGDAYGHYLTALKGYYRLLADNDFTWVPQSESVLVLGQEVAVDYMDERKFAAAAVALARTGNQVVDLTWRKDYLPGKGNGWDHFGKERENEKRKYISTSAEVDDDGNKIKTPTARHWGIDHWASRVGQGTYVNWLVGNAMVPSIDDDPNHEGIQKVDRTTVLELYEIPTLAKQLQITLDNAAAGLNPLGLPENSVAFDINPRFLESGSNVAGQTHYDQIYGRAVKSLDNAVAAFDASKDITTTMRSEQDSAANLEANVSGQELAYKHQLIEIYGTPYPEDIGPGKLYKQGYDGPDLLNFNYIDYPSLPTSIAASSDVINYPRKHRIYIERLFDSNSQNDELHDNVIGMEIDKVLDNQDYTYNFTVIKSEGSSGLAEGVHYVDFEMADHGLLRKPGTYTSMRMSPGRLQSTAHAVVVAYGNVEGGIREMQSKKRMLDTRIDLLNSMISTKNYIKKKRIVINDAKTKAADHRLAADTVAGVIDPIIAQFDRVMGVAEGAVPTDLIFGFSNGGSLFAPLRALVAAPSLIGITIAEVVKFGVETAANEYERVATHKELDNDLLISKAEDSMEVREALYDLEETLVDMRTQIDNIDGEIAIWDESKRTYQATRAAGDRMLKEREIFRKRSAAVVQGYRTRDAAFRIFRNEKLERYKSMLDLASRYTFLAAKAFDYETGLLDTPKGKRFISRIVASRALGVIDDGVPQFAGSNQGDPGLSSVLAEMSADWEVLRGRLGFNNPDTYGTTLSLRTENYRLLPNTAGDIQWKQTLETGSMEDLLVDPDARELCMQLDLGDGLPVPGIILEFRTTIQDGYNIFGKKLAAGDHAYSPSLFATKIMGVGVALEGYEGIDYYDGNGKVINPNPSINPNGLSATPYVYLIPVGVDAMRSPPLGDQSRIRTWKIEDATIPMPFNIGGSDFDTKRLFQTADSLTERMFNVRKHQAFRPVSSGNAFAEGPILGPAYHLNNRLVGRSVWNSRWKLIIPGKALLYDSKEGIDKFIRTVEDIKIHFETYSYSGN
ncbi:hypothetical protein OAH16_00740 [bacterium]|nr:hypothetical protein [bacterium]